MFDMFCLLQIGNMDPNGLYLQARNKLDGDVWVQVWLGVPFFLCVRSFHPQQLQFEGPVELIYGNAKSTG